MNTQCDQCRTLSFKRPDADIGSVGALGDGGRLVHVLHRTKGSWLRSIADGCHFCSLVKGQVYTCEVPSRVCDILEAYVILVVAVFPQPLESIKVTTRTVQIISRLGNASFTEIDHLPGMLPLTQGRCLLTPADMIDRPHLYRIGKIHVGTDPFEPPDSNSRPGAH